MLSLSRKHLLGSGLQTDDYILRSTRVSFPNSARFEKVDTGHYFRWFCNERKADDGFFAGKAYLTEAMSPAPQQSQSAPPQPGQQPPPEDQNQQPGQQQNQMQRQQNQPQTAPPAPPPANPSQKAISAMVLTSNQDQQLAPGISVPANSTVRVTPGDLSGNVTVDVDGKTHKVPDANLKNLIRSGGLQVSQTESLAKQTEALIYAVW